MVQNNEVNEYFRNLQTIGTFGVYENRNCTGFAIRISEQEAEGFENKNGLFISVSEYGNHSIMVMKAPENSEEIGIDEVEKLKVGFKVSGLTLAEAEAEARSIQVENEGFLSMMAGKGGGVTTKPPVKIAEFNIEE